MSRALYSGIAFLLLGCVLSVVHADEYVGPTLKIVDPVVMPSGYSTSSVFQLWSTLTQPGIGTSASALFQEESGFEYFPSIITLVPSSTPTVPGGGRVSSSRSLPTEPLPAAVTFSGLAQPFGRVVILRDGNIVGITQADSLAAFSLLLSLSPGSSVFSIYGTDTNGIRSGRLSFSLKIISNAITGIKNIFIPPTISWQGAAHRIISGQTVPQAQVIVDVSGGGKGEETIADTNGGYSILLHALSSVATVKTSAVFNALRSPAGVALYAGTSGVLRPADINGDSQINLVDFSILAYWYGRANFPPTLDLSGDGVLSIADFSILAFYWTG